MKRCAFCGGRLGLVSHREGSLRFCKRVHKLAYLQCQREQQKLKAEGGSGLIFITADRPKTVSAQRDGNDA